MRTIRRLRYLWNRRQRENQLHEEIEEHIALHIDDLIEKGMNPEDAKFRARRRFGNAIRVRERSREVWVRRWIDDLVRDLIGGIRLLLRNRSYGLVAVSTLALGIGANTAIFSAVESAVLRPLPYPNADRLVVVWLDGRNDSPAPPETYAAVEASTRTIEGLTAWSGWSFTVTGDGEAEVVRGARVTPSFFELLGAVPLLGRTLPDDETQLGSAAVLSQGFWERRYGGDPSVIGRTITIGGEPVPIVGVLPENFAFPSPETELWLPVAINPSTPPQAGGYLMMMGRISKDATLESALAEVRSIARRLRIEHPGRFPKQYGTEATLTPLAEEFFGSTRSRLLLLFGAVGAVLLIACANLANLMLAQATGRSTEMSIRAALGAGRRRLVGQVMTEHIVLVGLGALVGLALAHWGAGLLGATLLSDIPDGGDLGLNGRVLAFTFGLTILVGILSGIAPALRAARGELQGSLREAGRGSRIGRGRRRLLDSFVVSEIAIALVLLVGAGLVLQSFWRLSRQNTGFRAENVLTFRAAVPAAAYPESGQRVRFTAALLERLATLPGSRSVGAVHLLPFGGSNWVNQLLVEGRPTSPGEQAPTVDWRAATPDYFRTVGIPLLAGRAFTEDDRLGTPPVALVGQTLARELFPGEDPIGQRVRTLFDGENWATIVGVVRDTKDLDLRDAARPQMYRPFAQASPFGSALGSMTYTIRTDRNPLALARAVREVVKEIDPNVPVADIQLLEDVAARSITQPRLLMMLLVAFGAVSLLMAALGIYGVIGYAVRQRTREFGIRLALGARPTDLLRQVFCDGARLAVLGVLVGLGGASLLTRFLQSELYEIQTHDPLTFAAMAILLVGVALVASYLPARRAARVDPMASLAEE